MRKMQYLAVFTSTMNMISYGMAYGWPSPSLPKLFAQDSPIKITNSQGSWISVMPCIGALFGAPVFAILADKVGRKKTILLTAAPLIISWLLIGSYPTIESIMFARILAGIGGSGLFTVVPTYISEVTEPKIRGELAAMLTWTWNVGILLIYICAPFISIESMAFISLSLPCLFLLCFVWMPESPYFYEMKGRKEEARETIIKFRGKDNVDNILEEIEQQLSLNTNSINFFDIFKTSLNRKILFLVLFIITVQEFSGRAPFVFYSESIFQAANAKISAHYISIIYGSIQLISSFSASFIVDKFGRKFLLILSCIGTIICLITEGTCFFFQYHLNYSLESINWLPVVTLILFVIIFTVGLGVVPMIVAGEMFATNVKSMGMCIVDLHAAFTSIIVAKFFQISRDELGQFVPFWTFAGINIVGLIIIIKILPETKGLSLEEIQKILHRSNN